MSELYTLQLLAIREMLKSPQQSKNREAYSNLLEIWLECSENANFDFELKQLIREYPNTVKEFTNRLNKILCPEEEKTRLIKKAILLYPSEKSQENEDHVSKIVTPKIFVSYSHKDETFKNELITMLAGLQRRGVVDTWQDRRIEAGSDWFSDIKKNMEECHIALLLVSPDFIASGFIQEIELMHLFQRRLDEGIRVIPVIVRSCLWQSEPILKDLQALPKDGKPIISFSKDNGDRDQVWTEIGLVIENIVQQP